MNLYMYSGGVNILNRVYVPIFPGKHAYSNQNSCKQSIFDLCLGLTYKMFQFL